MRLIQIFISESSVIRINNANLDNKYLGYLFASISNSQWVVILKSKSNYYLNLKKKKLDSIYFLNRNSNCHPYLGV